MRKSAWNRRWSRIAGVLVLPRNGAFQAADPKTKGDFPTASLFPLLKPDPNSPRADSRDPDAVRAMFGRIAHRYDLANHLLSGGADFFWRRRATEIVGRWRPGRVLDLATGSGDLALALQRRLPGAEIIAADFSPEMLNVAKSKGVRETVLADALHLPFEAESFECLTVAFGLRNMSNWDRALGEMARVLQPEGHLLVLDFSLPAGVLRPAYRFYLHHCLPHLAALVTGQKAAYDYLGGSIEKFPSGGEMTRLIERNGFAKASAKPLTGGIATIYTAQKA